MKKCKTDVVLTLILTISVFLVNLTRGTIARVTKIARDGVARLLVLTYVRESSGRSFAKLFGFVGQRDLHDSGDGPGRRLHLYGVRSQELRG